MSFSVPCLKVTLDLDKPEEFMNILSMDEDICDQAVSDDVTNRNLLENDQIYCSCQSDYCDCGSMLGITQLTASRVYKHLGFPIGRSEMMAKDYRLSVVHLWGTHNLSTDHILNWLADYRPQTIEWINDASCNVVFATENAALRVIVDCAEAFDRRVALAAAAALASLINSETRSIVPTDESLQVDRRNDDATTETPRPKLLTNDDMESIDHYSQYLPPTGRWYKALTTPAQAVSLYLRFAHKKDVKLPGAERRSLYYRRFGNPNYGGMTGILTRSYRKRLRTHDSSSNNNYDHRHVVIRVTPPNFAELIANEYDCPVDSEWNSAATVTAAPERSLVVYDNLYDGDETMARSKHVGKKPHTGQRRLATGFPFPKPSRQPHKWSRHDRGPIPNRWFMKTGDDDLDDSDCLSDDLDVELPQPGSIIVFDPREPWGGSVIESKSNRKTRARRRIHKTSSQKVKMITLMPDPQDCQEQDEVNGTLGCRRLLTSMSMVADLEETNNRKSSIADRLGTSFSSAVGRSASNSSRRTRKFNVWQRLG